jgi:hypothetical protein
MQMVECPAGSVSLGSWFERCADPLYAFCIGADTTCVCHDDWSDMLQVLSCDQKPYYIVRCIGTACRVTLQCRDLIKL